MKEIMMDSTKRFPGRVDLALEDLMVEQQAIEVWPSVRDSSRRKAGRSAAGAKHYWHQWRDIETIRDIDDAHVSACGMATIVGAQDPTLTELKTVPQLACGQCARYGRIGKEEAQKQVDEAVAAVIEMVS